MPGSVEDLLEQHERNPVFLRPHEDGCSLDEIADFHCGIAPGNPRWPDGYLSYLARYLRIRAFGLTVPHGFASTRGTWAEQLYQQIRQQPDGDIEAIGALLWDSGHDNDDDDLEPTTQSPAFAGRPPDCGTGA